ncbi:hypothetical protein CDD80_3534 [Ophiocordyceps camponoti-rufipedis]|uniref:Uncharacterized protein n=1 Tax=Ophiocordyceps camponoti-rufipedis TaxID=2004952 RepID=A0A2C5Z3B2_9HYPO|nr:hypothetical protein CDD80_3534 [Ophiocordyceps camponoti-rufipedis]
MEQVLSPFSDTTSFLCPTESSSTFEQEELLLMERTGRFVTKEDVSPWPGKTFIIRSRSDGRVITLLDGKVLPIAMDGNMGSYYWTCVEVDMFLGFRNKASTTYLGHNGQGLVRATAPHHKQWEHFAAWKHPEGGWELLMTLDGKKLKLGFGKDGERLEASSGKKGDQWEFIEVAGWSISPGKLSRRMAAMES